MSYTRNESFISKTITRSNSFYQLLLTRFSFYKRTLGSIVKVERVNIDSDAAEAYGSMYTSGMLSDSDIKNFPVTLVFNMNDMYSVWEGKTDSLIVYDNCESLQRGDTIKFTSGPIEYKFKVVEVKSYSAKKNLLWEFEMHPIKEVTF